MVHRLKLKGDHRTIGFEHGRQAKSQICDAIQIYDALINQLPGQDTLRVKDLASEFRTIVSSTTPHLAREIEGIAEGAQVDEDWIYVLNARSEIIAMSIPECTSICSPLSGFLAQNWDYLPSVQHLVLLLEIELDSGMKLITLTEPGMVGKIGMNSAGIGVCLNMLLSNLSAKGLPIHILLRWLMEANSKAEVEERLSQLSGGLVGNVLVGSGSGWGINLEFLDRNTVRTDLAGENFVHTNHALGTSQDNEAFFDNSKARLDVAQEWAANKSDLDFPALDQFCSDQSHPQYPILAPVQSINGVEFGTLNSVVMSLRERRFWLRSGSDCDAEYQQFSLQ